MRQTPVSALQSMSRRALYVLPICDGAGSVHQQFKAMVAATNGKWPKVPIPIHINVFVVLLHAMLFDTTTQGTIPTCVPAGHEYSL